MALCGLPWHVFNDVEWNEVTHSLALIAPWRWLVAGMVDGTPGGVGPFGLCLVALLPSVPAADLAAARSRFGWCSLRCPVEWLCCIYCARAPMPTAGWWVARPHCAALGPNLPLPHNMGRYCAPPPLPRTTEDRWRLDALGDVRAPQSVRPAVQTAQQVTDPDQADIRKAGQGVRRSAVRSDSARIGARRRDRMRVDANRSEPV
jgi:hypothetical protein